MCTNAKVKPIINPEIEDFFSSEVTPNIVYINTNVGYNLFSC